MINLDLFILVEEVKQVSKDFDVFPKNVNAENAASTYDDPLSLSCVCVFNGCFYLSLETDETVICSVLPVMLATKLLPEMETDNKVKIDQLLHEVQSLPIPTQIETLKVYEYEFVYCVYLWCRSFY